MLGYIYRDLVKYEGDVGILQAKFEGVNSQRGRLIVQLVASDSSEGPITVFADLGASAEPTEFLDYRKNDEVLAAIRIRRASKVSPTMIRQFPGMIPSPPILSARSPISIKVDPLSAWTGISADCTRINKRLDNSSLVSATGPRRSLKSVPPLTTTDVKANPEGTVGLKIEWKGQLNELVEREGECHLLVDGKGPDRSTFEAYVRNGDFIQQLSDYTTYAEDHDGADTVNIQGKVANNEAQYRIRTSVPLVELREIWKTDQPSSRAIVGGPRELKTITGGQTPPTLAAVWRNPPKVRNRVRFRAVFEYFSNYDKTMRVENGKRSSISASVELTRSEDIQLAKELHDKKWLIVDGVVSKPPDTYQFTITATSVRLDAE